MNPTEPRWRYRQTFPTAGEWHETTDEYVASGLFLDMDFDVETVNAEAAVRTFGPSDPSAFPVEEL